MRRTLATATVTLGMLAATLGAAAPAQAAPFPSSFQIQSLHNGLCLAVDGGENVRVETCDPSGLRANQVFKMVGEQIRSRLNGRCLDVKHGQVDAAVQAIGDCHNHANQRWQWTDGDSTQSAHIRTLSTLQVMSIENGGGSRGINMRNVANANWQRWKTVEV